MQQCWILPGGFFVFLSFLCGMCACVWVFAHMCMYLCACVPGGPKLTLGIFS